MKSNMSLGFRGIYNNDSGTGTPTPEQQAAAAAAKVEADKVAAAAAAAANNDNDPAKKLNFTPEQQDFMNRKIAEEKRQWQTQNQKTIDELKKLQGQASTSEQQKKELQTRIDDLQRQHMSKEELAKQDQERQQREYQQALQTQKTEAETWRTRYHESTITRALQDGAIEFEAFNSAQIIDILYPKTKLVEEMDENNQATGNLTPRVHLTEIDDKTGKTVTLDLTVKEALTKMKNTPEKWGNLFKSTLAGGLGQNGAANGGGVRKGKNPKDMTPAEWAEARKKDPNFAFVQAQ